MVKRAPAGIAGSGVCIPARIMTNEELEDMVNTSDEWITSRTGIKERRIAAKGQKASDLAIVAGRNALADAGVPPEELDLIIVATASPDYMFPSTASIVQDRIGAPKAAAFDLLAGCSGFVYALVTAAQFIEAGLYKNVLVIGSEILSENVDWEDRNTCVLFGDAAGAVVLQPVSEGYGLLASSLGSDGSGDELLVLGNDRCIRMNGKEVFKFAVRVLGDVSQEVLQKAGLVTSDISLYIPHQANNRIIEAAAKRLNLPMEKVYVNVDRYGNTSAASIPVALHEARQENLLEKGDHLVLVGFGAGLTWGAAVIRWSI